MKKYFFSILAVFFLLNNFIFSKISFDKLDLNKNDELLFTVCNESTGIAKYNALLTVKIPSDKSDFVPQCASFYPEQMELLDNGKILQIRNIYATAKYDVLNKKLTSESVVKKLSEKPLPLLPYSVSFDGAWYCYLKKTSFLTADLILKDVTANSEYVLSKNVKMNYEKVPVKWSPEKNLLLYEKNGNVYFCNPSAIQGNVEIDEKYRKIGRGAIDSANFASSKYIIYADDSLLYKINTKELYTLGLYSEILGKGTVIGRLPFKFNPKTDKFSPNEKMNAFMFIQNKRMFAYLTANKESGDYMNVLYSRPYVATDSSLIDSEIFWDKNENPVLRIKQLPYDSDKIRNSVNVLKINDFETNKDTPEAYIYNVLTLDDSEKLFVSPDGSKAGCSNGNKFYIYDLYAWNKIAELPREEKIVSAVWLDSDTLFVGGEKSVRKWNCVTGKEELIAISSVNAAFWKSDENSEKKFSIVADNGSGEFYEFLTKTNSWKKINFNADKENSAQNGRFRVFTNTSANCNFENAVYIRKLGKNPVTIPLYKETAEKKSNPKKVAVIFDAYDNADGLAQIIYTLKKYNIKGDFFINGEFIRRYPQETRQIVKNEYNCNSMFFSLTDLTQKEFLFDEDFIRRGLARNEDEFYQCTQKELAVFWHAPYYKTTEKIVNYAKNAGYVYLNGKTENLENEFDTPFDIIQKYYAKVVKEGGGVIPVTVGYSTVQNREFLYDYLDVLINGLAENGFEIVGINEL